MKLKGKSKIVFESWFLGDYSNELFESGVIMPSCPKKDVIRSFYQLPIEMQYGVYYSWFDSVEIELHPWCDKSISYEPKKFYSACVNDIATGEVLNDVKSSLVSVITAAYQLYNSTK